MIARAGANFDAHHHLCNAMICQIKTLPKLTLSHNQLGPLGFSEIKQFTHQNRIPPAWEADHPIARMSI